MQITEIKKKKVALCLSGHLRYPERWLPYLKRNIIDPLNADVFIHTWDSNGKQRIINGAPAPDETTRLNVPKVMDFFDPKKIAIENNEAFIDSWLKSWKDEIYILDLAAKAEFITSQLYSIYKSNQVRLEYCHENKVEYDIVIRMRADYRILYPLDDLCLQQFEYCTNDKIILVPDPPFNHHDHPACNKCKNGYHSGPHDEVCDVFAIGSCKAITHYANLYINLKEVWRDSLSKCDNLKDQKKFKYCDKRNAYVIKQFWKPFDAELSKRTRYKYTSFNPERLFMHHLEGYRLIGSRINGKLDRQCN